MFRAPVQPKPAAEAGFILIEVLVSAFILAIVAGAVLTLLSATTRSAASERTRSEAYSIAQEDQARLRSMRISSLNRMEQERPVNLGGTKFTVKSNGLFVSNATGSEACNAESSPADYVRITSTVSSPSMANAVVMQSIVSPSNGSLDPSHGTLSINATTATGTPLSGVLISGSGISTFSGSTDSTGCANFADLPSGNYRVATSAGGLINPEGKTSTSKEIGVPASGTQPVSLMYDKAGTIKAKLVYRVGSTTTMNPAPVDSIEVFNAEGGTTATTYGTPGGARSSIVEAPSLFPFKTKSTVYAGSCETNNPDPEEKKPANDAAMGFVLVPAGGVAQPEIQVPALNLTVTYNGSVVKGARVTITDTNAKCKYNGSSVKRAYTTNEGGQQSSSATGLAELGLPWGIYKVCASAKVKTSEYRRIEAASVAVENLTSGTTLGLSLSGSGSTSGSTSATECP